MKEALKLALEALELAHPRFGIATEKHKQAIAAIKAALAQEQEPVDFTSLLREAEEIVQSKPTWKRFIDGTPLSNDIAVWMAVFAQDVARRNASQPAQRTWVGLTDREKSNLWLESRAAIPRFHTYATLVEANLKELNT